MPTPAIETPSITIRDVRGQTEIRAVEEMQKTVWGLPELDIVPTTQLVAAQAAGGVLLGAFDDETLIGFVYGFPGFESGQPTHHSHMLAVNPAYRNHNLGWKLKTAQRERVLTQGINVMTWTFDPLQSANAHFNFGKLGVIADRYFVNFYGTDAASFLHRSGTDRLWVTWRLASRRTIERLEKTIFASEFGAIKPLIEIGEDAAPRISDFDEKLPREQIAIEIPTDINVLERKSGDLARKWREATRRVFTEAFAAGYAVKDFHRGTRGGIYLLNRKKEVDDFC